MRPAQPARALVLVLSLATAGCVADADKAQVPYDASAPDAGVPYEGCYATGAWSSAAYEGAPFSTASMVGMVNGQEVGRAQHIRLRASHEFSIDSYSTDVRGPYTASSWMWHARCADDTDYYSGWRTETENVFYASGCANGAEALYFRARVRAGNEDLACDPDASLAPGG